MTLATFKVVENGHTCSHGAAFFQTLRQGTAFDLEGLVAPAENAGKATWWYPCYFVIAGLSQFCSQHGWHAPRVVATGVVELDLAGQAVGLAGGAHWHVCGPLALQTCHAVLVKAMARARWALSGDSGRGWNGSRSSRDNRGGSRCRFSRRCLCGYVSVDCADNFDTINFGTTLDASEAYLEQCRTAICDRNGLVEECSLDRREQCALACCKNVKGGKRALAVDGYVKDAIACSAGADAADFSKIKSIKEEENGALEE